MDIVTLRNACLHAEVLPGVGGAFARFDWIAHGKQTAVFRPCPLPPISPSQVACFAMLPWANRMSPGGFEFEGRKISIGANRPGERCPIHGEGWQNRWNIAFQSATELRLTLDRSLFNPYSYRAELHYSLADSALQVGLAVCNTGDTAMPFGVGLHPWFERGENVRLRATAANTWRRNALGLPAEPVPLPSDWDFSSINVLPKSAVDHLFGGWNGEASIELPERGIKIGVTADMGYFVLYAPSGADFFCFEPIDHMINAHSQVLLPGEQLRRQVLFNVDDM